MGIFGNDDGVDEIDLDKELAEAGEPEPKSGDAGLDGTSIADHEPSEFVRVEVITAHNGLRRGDRITVTRKRFEQMQHAGLGKAVG